MAPRRRSCRVLLDTRAQHTVLRGQDFWENLSDVVVRLTAAGVTPFILHLSLGLAVGLFTVERDKGREGEIVKYNTEPLPA